MPGSPYAQHAADEAPTAAPVAVFGASGHTGRFVVAELQRRGLRPRLVGRDALRLRAVAAADADVRVATTEDPASLDRALAGAAAVINCAGPFLDTAPAVLDAALRAGIHYLDVTAEQGAALAAFERCDAAARQAGVVVLPAMAFYGGLPDLLATAATADWAGADAIETAIALDSWRPTLGTRLTGRRNTARRLVVSGSRLVPLADPPPRRRWAFAAPFGEQDVVALPFSEIATMSRHLAAPEIHTYLNLAPLADLRDPATPPPEAADPSGRSGQTFLVEVVARRSGEERRAVARGRDIYAVTAPLVVEAAARILAGTARGSGALAPGAAFDARDFLAALGTAGLAVDYAGMKPSGPKGGL